MPFDMKIGAPPATERGSANHYNDGYAWAKNALQRYGAATCARFRKTQVVASSYDQGAADAFDGKPNKYGKQTL